MAWKRSTHWLFGKFQRPLIKIAERQSSYATAFPRANVGLYEHPACQAPPPPFLSFFLTFLLFEGAAGFPPPRPHIVADRRAQMLSRLAASSAATTLWGARPL